ncbi:unnamed protein product [Rotaria magnacalcarata]|uniref:Ig-like domain-containing protein n=1 Tax=Rotaria magnacalcarata TaxID=392030 RepID=A0A816F175_9BILA|nr:unnamed protein product [Rotaria magnacalcarata]
MVLTVIIFILLLFSSSTVTFDDYLEKLSVNTGEATTLICDLPERYFNKPVDFYGPTGRLLVLKTGENIGSDDRTRFMLEHKYAWTWSLILSDVSEEDAGEYTCRISTDDRTLTIIKRFDLTVLTPPKIIDITIESNNNGILIENEQIVLKCLTRGVPQPKIHWDIPAQKIISNENHKHNIIPYDNKLIIRNFSRTTPMNYQCIADNGIPPRDTRTRHLVPAIPPEVTVQTTISRFSSQILLNCTIIARPLRSAKWKRNRIEMNSTKRIEINDYTIQLPFLIKFDPLNYTNLFGMYECEAENQFKVSKAYIIINESILSDLAIAKQDRISSSPTYAQIELLLNCSLSLSYDFYVILFINIFIVTYSSGFYNKQ